MREYYNNNDSNKENGHICSTDSFISCCYNIKGGGEYTQCNNNNDSLLAHYYTFVVFLHL